MRRQHSEDEVLAADTGQLDLYASVLTLRDDRAGHPRDIHVRAGGGTIGRSPDCDVCVEDDRVSRRHAEVRLRGGRWWVEDLGSTNGTWVNGNRVTSPAPLARGDRLRLGNLTLHVHAGDASDSPAAETRAAAAAHNVTFGVHGHQSGRIDMIGRDKYDYSRHTYEDRRSQTNYFGDNPILMIWHASGVAKLLMILGVFVSLSGAASWGYPIVRAVTEGFSQPAGSFDPPDFQATPWLPLGAALAFGGSLVFLVGMAMTRRDRR